MQPWLVRSGLALAVVAALAGRVRTAPADDGVRAAIATAIAARLGPDASVDIRDVSDVRLAGPVIAMTIDPSARYGSPIDVLLFTAPATSVRAVVDARILVEHARAAVAMPRGHVIAASDLAPARSEVFGPPLRPLPTAARLVGARTLRTIAPGDIVLDGFVAILPLVRAGAPVTAVARVGDVEVSAPFVATDNGNPGDIIRIVNPDTHRTLHARVVSAGTVEVVNVR